MRAVKEFIVELRHPPGLKPLHGAQRQTRARRDKNIGENKRTSLEKEGKAYISDPGKVQTLMLRAGKVVHMTSIYLR